VDELERQASVLRDRASAPPIDRVRTRAGALRRRRHALVAAVALLVVGGATAALVARDHDDRSRVDTVDDGTAPTTTLATTPSSTAAPTDTTSVPSIPVLPTVGVAVQVAEGVQLVAIDGTVLTTLPRYSLDINWRPELGVRVVRDDGAVFGLDLRSNALVPALPVLPEHPDLGPTIARPPITADVGIVVGHWRYVVQSPTGQTRLAQWSGECELPLALFVDEDHEVRSPFGGPWTEAPVSFALGWTDDGRALVYVQDQPACGAGGRRGVHLVAPDGEATLLVDGAAAQAWTSSPRIDRPAAPRSWPAEVGDELVLTGDAIGTIAIGSPMEDAIAAVTAVLGRQDRDQFLDTAETGFPVDECGRRIRVVDWQGLSLMFRTDEDVNGELLQWTIRDLEPQLRTAAGWRVGLGPGSLPEEPDIVLRFTENNGPRAVLEMRGGRTECIGD
jgi:hypothetical protein